MDENVPFSKLKTIAQQAENKILKAVNLFDVYEGGKLAKGKKSYAISFTLADENKTLTDKYVDKVMEKLIKSFKEKVGAKIR